MSFSSLKHSRSLRGPVCCLGCHIFIVIAPVHQLMLSPCMFAFYVYSSCAVTGHLGSGCTCDSAEPENLIGLSSYVWYTCTRMKLGVLWVLFVQVIRGR